MNARQALEEKPSPNTEFITRLCGERTAEQEIVNERAVPRNRDRIQPQGRHNLAGENTCRINIQDKIQNPPPPFQPNGNYHSPPEHWPRRPWPTDAPPDLKDQWGNGPTYSECDWVRPMLSFSSMMKYYQRGFVFVLQNTGVTNIKRCFPRPLPH